jgi:ABC-2 type transport system ATP-binding protein
VLTTHYIEEADQLCERIGIINQGELAVVDTPEKLKSLVQREHVIQVVFDCPARPLVGSLEMLSGVERVLVSGETVKMHVQDVSDVLPSLLDLARERGLRVVALNTTRPTLEDAFLALTGLHPQAMSTEKA